MMRFVLMAMTLCLLMACHDNTGSDEQSFVLQGAWTLQQVDYPYGRTETFSMRQGMPLRLYEGDSVIYTCMIAKTETGLIVRHSMMNHVTLLSKGNGEYVYMEDGDPRPLTIVNDSTIVIQRNGALSTWHRADDIAQDWNMEIKNIITADLQLKDENGSQSYVLSAKERRQADIIHIFIIATIGAVILLLLIVRIAVQNRRAKQRLQLQLQQIQEVRQRRQPTVRQAIETVETAFFASDDYDQLQHRITSGQRLKEADWQEIEGNVRKVYPGFISQLRGLYTMSELEYQVCLLIKLRIAPSDIAAVLARDVSTISTVRSRLYKKVFGQKGGSREWDEFILSIGG